jgi:competence protein ComEC
MLFFLDDRKGKQRVVKQFILLFLIWFYAMLAGLAPSILRATIMLSFVIIGNVINRKGVLLNSLAASAFILLCMNPSNLFDIGFLLSYVAVIGIVVLQGPISKMFYSKYKIVNKIWEITSVTIAAQLATAPFTIYYFHQFPIYFWLSNLFMTPISSVVIVGGMILLLIFFIPYINSIVAFFVSKMIFVMNFGVSWIESLPYSIVKGIYINEIQFVILLLILLSLLFLVELRSKKMLFLIMMMSCCFGIVNVYNLMEQKKQNEMIVYSINNRTVIDFIKGKSHILVSDSIFFEDNSAFSYNIENFLIKRGAFNDGK